MSERQRDGLYLRPEQNNAETEQEYVYGIGHPHGYVKIGRSTDPDRRLKSHQTGCPYELWIIVQIPVDDSRTVEEELQEHLADSHVRGEWYELSYIEYDMLADMMKMADSTYDFNSVDDFRQWQDRKREALK